MIVPDVGSVSRELLPRVAEDEAKNGVDAGELQRTCVTVLRAGWSTLALVAMDAQMPARELANALVGTAQAYRLRPVRALHAQGAGAAQVMHVLDGLAEAGGGDVRTVIAVDDPLAHPHRMPLVIAADAALFVVRLGMSTIQSVDAMANVVGRERVVGCVVIPR